MSKRKREDEEGEMVNQDERLRSEARFRASFGQSVSILTEALKLARGFERQKFGRRQKQASGQPKNLLRLREEVIVLKQLDLEKTAKDHLTKHLSKIKRIRESPIFTSTFGDAPKVAPVKSGAETNVLALLFKSTPVKEAVDRTVQSTYESLGLQQGKPATAQEESDVKVFPSSLKQVGSGRLPATSPSVSEDEGGGDVLVTHSKLSAHLDEGDADSFASFESESVCGSPSPSPSLELQSTTAFLPALENAGFYSGSDSEGSEIEPEQPKARKNRRGQRARQQLAELKFGKNAKHLQKSQVEHGRDAGWDPKRGAVNGSDRQNRQNVAARGRTGQDQSLRGSWRQVANVSHRERPKTRDDAGSLHPSWSAAKQRKQQSGGPAAFAGKKITFD